MKKTLSILMVMVLAVGMLTAANSQKIYSVDSLVYPSIEKLYILAGKSLPSSSGPWSEDELQRMLHAVNRESLDDTAKAYYDYVETLVTSTPKTTYSDGMALSFGLDLNTEVYAHTNSGKFENEENWFHGFTSRAPFLLTSLETWPTDHFYGYFELSLGNNIGYATAKANAKNNQYKGTVNTNLPVLNGIITGNYPVDGDGDVHLLADFDWSFPYRAFAAVGGDHWSLSMGRDKLSWGSGETGNLMLSSHFPRHNNIRFSTYYDDFKYAMVVTMYPTMNSIGDYQYKSLDGYKALVTHRLEFNLLDGKLGLAVNEAAMLWSTTYTDDDGNTVVEHFSPLQVNPFGFMHNEYIAANSNSILVFEADYTPVKGINLYGQFAVDEFAGPGEGRTNPSAKGMLAGVKGVMTYRGGIAKASFEAVKTDPFLYIRGLHYNHNEPMGYGFDAVFRSVSSDALLYKKMFVTYPYGNDVIVLDAKLSYEIPGKATIGLEGMVKTKGTMDVNSRWGQFRGDWLNVPDPKTPTEYSPFDDVLDPGSDPNPNPAREKNAVETTCLISLTGSFVTPVEGLSLRGALDFQAVSNLSNRKGDNQNDLQLSIGASYSI